MKTTPNDAYKMGAAAAHEPRTPICPFSRIYEPIQYARWYDGLAYIRRMQK